MCTVLPTTKSRPKTIIPEKCRGGGAATATQHVFCFMPVWRADLGRGCSLSAILPDCFLCLAYPYLTHRPVLVSSPHLCEPAPAYLSRATSTYTEHSTHTFSRPTATRSPPVQQ